jgi:hypothetical protein
MTARWDGDGLREVVDGLMCYALSLCISMLCLLL